MPDSSNGTATSTAAKTRGSHTRDRLLDAVEAVAADQGLGGLSHRTIARRANVHAGLIHYHFGTVEQLLEEALARRAARLCQAQTSALAALRARGSWSVEDVIVAMWQPFSSLGAAPEDGWRNYLCLVAQLGVDERGEDLLARHFAEATRSARGAIEAALPKAQDDALSAGLRYVRMLFEHESRERCRKARSPEQRAVDDRHFTAFAAAGLRGLCGEAPLLRCAPVQALAR